MALSDRDIIITPNRGASSEPIISLRGGDSSSSATMTMRIVNSGTVSTLSFEGTSGQLFSVSDTFAGTIFSANDISGIPSIEVLDSGFVKLAEYNGQVQIGGSSNSDNATSTATGELRVVGGAGVWKDLVVGGSITVGGSINAASISGTVTNSTNVTVTNDPTNASTHYLTMVTGTSGNLPIKVDGTGLVWIPSTNRLGVANTTPSFSLDVGPQSSPLQTVARFGNPGSDVLITHASAIISHNAYYNGGWLRSGAGYAGKVELQGGVFDFQTSPTTAAAGTSITDWLTRLMILNNGDVGIGTASPAATLHLVRSSNPYTRIQTGGGSYSYLQLDDGSSNGYLIKNVSAGTGNNALPGALYTYTDNSKAFQHIHAGTPLFTILSTGLVGIGNTAPAYKLSVITASDVWHAQFGTSGGKQVRIGGSTTNGGVIGAYNTDDNSSPASLLLQRDGGNVGIGTAAPSVRLHVVGSSILANSTSIDPDAYPNTVVAGGIADGSGWGVSSAIGGNAGTGDSWAIGHNGGYLYYGVGNGAADNTFATYMVTGGTGRHLWLTPASGGSVGIGIAEGTTPGRKLDVNGTTNISSHITQGTLVSRPNVTWGASGSSTGAVIIKFPGTSGNYGMIHCVIDIYTYDGEHASTVIVGGHNWNSAWYNYGATLVGSYSKGVRVGYKDGQYCIVLGTNTSSWSYGQVIVRKIQNGSYYSGVMDLGGTYSIAQDAAAESYTWISSNLIVPGSGSSGGWNSSNDGPGSGLDADTLDGIDSTGFVRSNAGTSGYIELNGGNQNAPNDATIYATATNNNDWLLRLNARNSSKSEYGAYVDIPTAATYAWAVLTDGGSWTWRVAGNGANYAPIYYDVSDTGYYVDPNDSSRLNGRLTVAAGHGDSSLRVMLNSAENGAGTGIAALQMWCSEPGNTWDWGGFGYNVDNSQNSNMPAYYFGRINPNFGQAYMRMGTGGQWYFYTATSGTGDYSGTRYTHIYLSPGNGVETYGILWNDTSVRAPIYYDRDNTGYYGNFASTSSLNNLAIRGDDNTTSVTNGTVTLWGTGGTSTSRLQFKLSTGSGINWGLHGALTEGYATYWDMDTPGRGWIFRNATAGTNVASIGNTSGVATFGSAWSSTTHAQLNVTQGQGGATLYRDIDIKGSWSGGEGHAISATHGSSASNLVGQVVFQHDSPGSRIKWGRLYHGGDSSVYPMQLISESTGQAYLEVNSGSMRAPLFYDYNNTSFYMDFAGYSRINQLTIAHGRTASTEQQPVGHYSHSDEVFSIDPSWTTDQLRSMFNSSNVQWVADSTAPGGYAIQITGGTYVGNSAYGSGFPWIAVDQDDIFYMEVWIKNVVTQNGHYMGSIDFDHNFGNLGGNPGSYGYWVMSNNAPTVGTWTKYSGYIGGFGNSTGQFKATTKYWTPQALFNYTGGGTSYISGWKAIRVRHPGTRTFAGEVRATSEITAYYGSDERLKENIQPIASPMTMLESIRGVYFDWTQEHIQSRGGEDGFFVRKHDIGVIAQEVEAILPEIVATRPDGFKAVKYEKLVPLLIEAIKDQKSTIDHLSAEVQELKELVQKSLGK